MFTQKIARVKKILTLLFAKKTYAAITEMHRMTLIHAHDTYDIFQIPQINHIYRAMHQFLPDFHGVADFHRSVAV